MTHGARPAQPVDGPVTLAVTGAKGGVGKSNLALNLAVSLGRWGRRVLLVDGDLGLANLDVLLGLVPSHTIEHLVRGEIGLTDLLLDGPDNVRLLPAASGVPQLTSLSVDDRRRILDTLSEGARSVDHVIVDTGAGLGDLPLSLQLAASRVVLVTTPEPTSMVDAYASLKILWNADPTKPVDLVVNAAKDEDEAERAYEQIGRAAEHFLGRRPGSLGAVLRDTNVAEAVRKQRAVIEMFPGTSAALCYEQIALRLAAEPGGRGEGTDYWERMLLCAGEELPH